MPEKNPKTSLKFILMFLSAGILCLPVLGFLLRSDGGINLDTIFYVRMAQDLPGIKSNIFPIGYPVLIRIFNSLIGDFFWTTKFINFSLIVLILVFSWYKKFFFTETVCLFCLKAGIGLWSFSYSEPLFLTFLYFQFYLLHQYFVVNNLSRSWPFQMSIVMILMLFARHTGIFIYAGHLVFFLFLLSKNGKSEWKKGFFKFLVISGIMICGYMAWNRFQFQSFFGENLRGAPEIQTQSEYLNHIFLNFKGAMTSWNPFFGIVLQHNSNPAYQVVEWGLLALDTLFCLMLFLFLLKTLRTQNNLFALSLLIPGLVFLILIFFSSINAGIEILNTRLLSPVTFCLFFPILILLHQSKSLAKRFILIICSTSLVFSFLYLIKTPANYLKIKERAEDFLSNHPKALFFYIDKDAEPETVYAIPGFSKALRYKHEVLKSSYINRNSLLIIKPEIEEVEVLKSGIESEKVILNSQVK